ncbi:MAG TPA: GNAT family N-acetyltransferase [Gammaproteobacteria bacterium]|nr:GNAT family N-acetyltransferase [Gammaproteobacteria bacterium]
MAIEFKTNAGISAEQFIDLLQRSTLAARRPVEDRECIEGMLRHANLTVTAWDGDKLVGIARSITDFYYACYLSDLAVDESYQRAGIGRTLVARTQQALGPRCKIRLVSAPAATAYYPKLGFVQNPQCWELGPSKAQALIETKTDA